MVTITNGTIDWELTCERYALIGGAPPSGWTVKANTCANYARQLNAPFASFGVGGGDGTVRSVALAADEDVFEVSGSPVTDIGTLILALKEQGAGLVFAGPVTGADGVPTFRVLELSDLPDGAVTGDGAANQLAYWDTNETISHLAKSYVLPDETRLTDYVLKFITALNSSQLWISVDAQGSKIQSYGSLPLYINKEGNPVFMPSIAGSGTRMVTVTGTGELSNAAIPSAGITGTLTAPRIPVASGAGTLVDYDDLRWDNTTKGIRAGAGAGAVVGTFTAYPANGDGFYAFASVSGSVYGTLENFWNVSGAGSAYWIIKVGGASAGDPFIMFVIASATTWSAGVDNSDNDIFKIGPYQNPGNGVLGLQILPTGEAAWGGAPSTALSLRIATAKPLGVPTGTDATRATGNANPNLQWNASSGRLEAISPTGPYYKPIISYTAPTGAVQASAGSGATVTFLSGSNAINGQFTLTTGSTSLGTGNVLRVTVSGNMGGVSFPILTARNSNAAAQATNIYIGTSSVTTFDIYVVAALAASTAYIFNYHTGS